MSDTVKLIIEIPKKYYEIIKHEVDHHISDYRPFVIIANGTPLDDVKAENKGEWKTRYEIIRNPWGEENTPQTKCSNCNFRVDTYSSQFMNFCPNCGARMKGGE